ncbi:hypothetical protein QUF76_10565 [Desulfobacterales bacterium HSG16]|nr:hypothetical protein [Desulfobacterales bacterium HSG16]
MQYCGKIVSFVIILCIIIICTDLFAFSPPIDSETERRKKRFGVGGIIGTKYTLSVVSQGWPPFVTFAMGSTYSMLVEIKALKKPATIILSGSQVSSNALLKAVWTHDDLRTPVKFWTADFWHPTGDCDVTGCPRLRFRVLRGAVTVKVLDKR